ncbi:hypothetical protein CPB83DRAFT_754229 [Crepidotus variabilis]|uniref:F-box domain-containing protein n=1 Tax=Crepidotus variabilis TaxID=179855 RepID=A0A9P6JX16_9AGAR|nr:hypothetical protein CPB83DRAFT_754229 [Crepidotus variabilis]
MFNHGVLPTEIWLEIIGWATYNPNIGDREIPFSLIPDNTSDSNLQVRAQVAAVCRAWNTWVTHNLYRDVKVDRNLIMLCETLDRPRGFDCLKYGQMVHRMVLPYNSTTTTSPSSLPSAEILKLCPCLHTLHRPLYGPAGTLRFEYEAQSVSLPSLRRLEWWHNMEAERSGGINSLADMLCSAPFLQYLFIGGVVGTTHMGTHRTSITMNQLETLRLHIRSGVLLRHIVSRWKLPSLKRVILDSLPAREGTHILWDEFGAQLEAVELGRHLQFLVTDSLTTCLRSCPHLQQLNYYLFFSFPPQEFIRHASLSTVNIHAHVNPMLLGNGNAWHMVEQHFEFLCSSGLSSLRHINLYGDWRAIIYHPQFAKISQKLSDCSKIVQR